MTYKLYSELKQFSRVSIKSLRKHADVSTCDEIVHYEVKQLVFILK